MTGELILLSKTLLLHKKRAYCEKSVKFSLFFHFMHETDAKVQSLRTGAGSLIKKIASTPSQAFLGTDLKDAIGPDGFKIGVEIAKATGIGRWVEYVWPNPVKATARRNPHDFDLAPPVKAPGCS